MADTEKNKPAAAKRPSGLGRGLSALLGDIQTEAPVSRGTANAGARGASEPAVAQRDGLSSLPIAEMHPHPDQPRRHFDETALQELADSIRTRGLVQPILVRPAPDGKGWQIVAGERRWRASQRAGLHEVPCVVRDLDEEETFTIALIENIQRQDLSAIEEAEAYARLRDRLGHAPDAIGKMTGKSRSHVANILRLLELPGDVRDMVADGRLGMGHARTLVGREDAVALANQAVSKGWSVRKMEAVTRRADKGEGGASRSTASTGAKSGGDADIAALESQLADILGLKVRIDHGADMRGTLSLDYGNLEQLDMLCQRLSGERF